MIDFAVLLLFWQIKKQWYNLHFYEENEDYDFRGKIYLVQSDENDKK